MTRALQNGNKIITNLAGDVINGSTNGSMYQRKNLKPLNLNGRESAPSTPIQSRMNFARYNSYLSPTGPTPPPPLSTRSVYSHHLHGHDIPPASTEREKRKMARSVRRVWWFLKIYHFLIPIFFSHFSMRRRFFATVSGISYAIFLIVFGAIVFIGDVVVSQYPLPQVRIHFECSTHAITTRVTSVPGMVVA